MTVKLEQIKEYCISILIIILLFVMNTNIQQQKTPRLFNFATYWRTW